MSPIVAPDLDPSQRQHKSNYAATRRLGQWEQARQQRQRGCRALEQVLSWDTLRAHQTWPEHLGQRAQPALTSTVSTGLARIRARQQHDPDDAATAAVPVPKIQTMSSKQARTRLKLSCGAPHRSQVAGRCSGTSSALPSSSQCLRSVHRSAEFGFKVRRQLG